MVSPSLSVVAKVGDIVLMWHELSGSDKRPREDSGGLGRSLCGGAEFLQVPLGAGEDGSLLPSGNDKL